MIDDFDGALRAERQGRRRDLRMGLVLSIGAGILALMLMLLAIQLSEWHSIPRFNQELIKQ